MVGCRSYGAGVVAPGIRRTLLALEGVTALGALGAGVLMLIVPDGPISMGDEVLADLGYHSWRTVALFLIAVNGLFPLLVIVADVRRHHLSGLGHLGWGVALLAWIVLQVWRIGMNSALQPTFFLVGVVVVFLAWKGYRSQILASLRTAS